jgi:hypothetical protein
VKQTEFVGANALMLRRHWNSLDEFLDDMRLPAHPNAPDNYSNRTNMPDWFGSESYEHALQMAEKGWPEGLARMEKIKGSVKQINPVMSERFNCRFVEAGDDVEVGRFLSGEPENMLEYELVQVPASGRVVKLVVNVEQSSGISADAVFLRGAAACILADMIEESGLRTEIEIIAGGNQSGNSSPNAPGSAFSVTVKKADQHLEPDRMAFILASASVFRRFMFRAAEQLEPNQFKKHVGMNYWRPKNIPVEGEGVVMVDTLHCGFCISLGDNVEAARFIHKMAAQFIEPQPA